MIFSQIYFIPQQGCLSTRQVCKRKILTRCSVDFTRSHANTHTLGTPTPPPRIPRGEICVEIAPSRHPPPLPLRSIIIQALSPEA